MYQELSFQDDNLESEENEVTGIVHPGEYASSGKTSNKRNEHFLKPHSNLFLHVFPVFAELICVIFSFFLLPSNQLMTTSLVSFVTLL